MILQALKQMKKHLKKYWEYKLIKMKETITLFLILSLFLNCKQEVKKPAENEKIVDVEVRLVWDPPWNILQCSDAVLLELGLL